MRYSTNILTSIIVFSTAVVANAQSYNSYYAPAPVRSNYGITQTNYQYAQPIRVNAPCLNGNCSQTIRPVQYPYTSNANYGLSQACVNGQCNHPQHQNRFINSARCPNGNCGLNCCVNGQCTTGQCLTGQCNRGPCTTGNCPTYRPANGMYGNSTIPFNRPFPGSYGSATPNNSQFQMNVSTVPTNSVTTIPVYNTQSYRPVNNSPYYN
ncbi:hypothetical protein N8553_02870 [bacterium]|jgi:hypothetical protein|nr:hypothetical protein [Planctomicrobium sp.]MDA7503906.1 hypothetical protein [bacterium]